jgi:hypothetical protein
MEAKKWTRRALLERGAVWGLVMASGAAGFGGCGGGLDCSNPPGLTQEQRDLRRSLAYVERAPNASQRCEVCRFYTAPEQPNRCGGCTLNLGPVNPQGYCSSFAPRG